MACMHAAHWLIMYRQIIFSTLSSAANTNDTTSYKMHMVVDLHNLFLIILDLNFTRAEP